MSVSEPTLFVGFELGKKQWKLALTSGLGFPVWLRTVPGGDLRAVERVLHEARRLLDSSRVDTPWRDQSRGGFGQHRGESAGAALPAEVQARLARAEVRLRKAQIADLDAQQFVRSVSRWLPRSISVISVSLWLSKLISVASVPLWLPTSASPWPTWYHPPGGVHARADEA